MSLKKHLTYLFKSFVEDYRTSKTRLNARVLFRMEINQIAKQIPDKTLYQIHSTEQSFIRDYSKFTNWILNRRPKIRLKAVNDFDTVIQRIPIKPLPKKKEYTVVPIQKEKGIQKTKEKSNIQSEEISK